MAEEAKAAHRTVNRYIMGEYLLLHKMSTFDQTRNARQGDSCVVNPARQRPTFAVAQSHECDGRDVVSLLYFINVLAKMVDGTRQRHRTDFW